MTPSSAAPEPRDLGVQPIAALMADHGITPAQVVAQGIQGITFKVVKKACQGRRLTPRMQQKVREALGGLIDPPPAKTDLFTY